MTQDSSSYTKESKNAPSGSHVEVIPAAKLPWWFFPLCILVIVTTIGFGFWVNSACTPDWSQFDALTALFTGLAFAGVIGTLFLQRDELKLQRTELIETRNVLSETSKANRDSADIAKKQMEIQEQHMIIQAKLAELDTELKILEILHPMNKSSPSANDLKQVREMVKKIQDIAGVGQM